jgi:hypothetical protein
LGHGLGLVSRSSTCPISSFVLRDVAVKSELRWSVPCGNDDEQLVDGEGLSERKAYHISLLKLVVKVRAVFYWRVRPIVGIWSGR